MFWLPKLVAGTQAWLLPLQESTASSILAVLVPPTGQAAAIAPQTFRQAIANDPGFALWLACRFPRNEVPAGIDDLTAWFLENPLEKLIWRPDAMTSPAPNWPDATWSELAQRSINVAQGSRRVAAEHNDPRGGPAELLGLLHLGDELLSMCGPTVLPGENGDAADCLPTWLTTALCELRHGNSADVTLNAVQQAIYSQPASSTEPPAKSKAATGVAPLLPGMVTALARLSSLEEDFAATLEAAKLDAMRELAYGASHEINNPLANISTRAQTLLVDEVDPERRRKLATINSQAFRAHEMISDIMLFAKPPQIEPVAVELAALVQEVLAELADDADEQGTELHGEINESLVVLADRGHLAMALKSLVRNSLEAIGMGGQIELAAKLVDTTSDRPQLEIWVTDSGPGIAPEVRSSMFNPFFSGREAGRGLGLGLSKCWRIIALHGGGIRLDETCTLGTRFIINLPIGAAQAVDPALATHD